MRFYEPDSMLPHSSPRKITLIGIAWVWPVTELDTETDNSDPGLASVQKADFNPMIHAIESSVFA